MARNQRLNATLTIGSVLERSVGRNLNLVRRGLDRVNDEIGELTARRRDMERQRRELERQGRSVEDLDREYEELGRTLEDLTRRQERYERAAAAARRVGDSFRSAVGEVGRLGRNVAIGVGAVGASMVELARRHAESIETITQAANRIGTSTEFLSALGFAAGQFGVETEALVDGLKELSMRADEFAETGGGPAAEAFGRLGISAEEAGRLASDTEELFAVVRDRLAEIDDVAARQRIADEVFGGSAGEQLIEVLQLSREELEALLEEASRAGAVISAEQSAIARSFERSWNRVGEVINGIGRSVSVELMPALSEAFDRLSEHLMDNRERVVELADAFGDWLGETIPKVGDLASGVGKVVGTVGRGIDRVAEFVGGFENLGKIVATLFAGKAVLAIAKLAFDVGRLGGALLALVAPGAVAALAKGALAVGAALTGPIGLAVAAVGVGVVLIWRNWDWLKDRLSAIADRIGEGFTWLWENAARPLIDGLSSAAEGIASAWDSVASGVGAALDALAEAFSRAWQRIEPIVDRLGSAINTFRNAERTTRTDSNGNVREVGPTGAIIGRAIGGRFPAGPVLVGERGPELRYENRSGFIAHHRALERMADYAQQAAGGMAAAGREAAQQVAQVTQNITINAQGLTAEAVIDEIDRRRQAAERGALFDGATGWGQYGGSHA